MEVKDKYLKYKTKYLELRKQLGGDCSLDFEKTYEVGDKKDIYLGITEVADGIPKDSPCNPEIFAEMYGASKTYLDNLSPLENFILWIYTKGAVARLVNHYSLGNFTVEDVVNVKKSKTWINYYFMIGRNEDLYNCILEIFHFKNKFNMRNNIENSRNEINRKKNEIVFSEKLDKFYDSLFLPFVKDAVTFTKFYEDFKNRLGKWDIWDERIKKMEDEIKKIKDTKSLEYIYANKCLNIIKDEYKKRFTGHLQYLKGINKTYNDKIIPLTRSSPSKVAKVELEVLGSKIFIPNAYYIESLFVEMMDRNLTSELAQTFICEIKKTLEGITMRAPKLTKCIKLFKAVNPNDEFKLGVKYPQKVINSVTCSRKTNLSLFIGKSAKCCLLEIICNPGIPVLFLDYKKTVYGDAAFEVLLPPNIILDIKAFEPKNMIAYDFKDQVINDDINKVGPLLNLVYSKPEVKNIKTYSALCTINSEFESNCK